MVVEAGDVVVVIDLRGRRPARTARGCMAARSERASMSALCLETNGVEDGVSSHPRTLRRRTRSIESCRAPGRGRRGMRRRKPRRVGKEQARDQDALH